MKFYFQNAILDVAYGIIDLAKELPKKSMAASLESASRSLAPAVAFAYALGYQFGVCYHHHRRFFEKHIILGGSTE